MKITTLEYAGKELKLCRLFSALLSGISKKISLFSLSFFLSLLLGELFIRVFFPQQLIVQPKIWSPMPGIGWRHGASLNKLVNTGERTVHFITDEQGYRIPPNSKDLKEQPAAGASIFMVGDSFLEALAVEAEEAVPEKIKEYLEKKYSLRTQVVNAGVSSWQPTQYLLESRRALSRTKYDAGVVFFYIGNDFQDPIQWHFDALQITPRKAFNFPRRFDWESIKKGILYPINNILDEKSHLFVFLKDRFQIALARAGLSTYYFPKIFFIREQDSRKWDRAADVAKMISEEFGRHGTPVLFVLLPTDYQVDSKALYKYITMFKIPDRSINLEQPNQRLAARLRQRSIPYVDMLPILRQKTQQGLPLYGLIDHHLNAEGHSVVAEAILPWIEKILKSKWTSNV